jgi:hypothetical protein
MTCRACKRNQVAFGNLCQRCYERIVRPEYRVNNKLCAECKHPKHAHERGRCEPSMLWMTPKEVKAGKCECKRFRRITHDQ